VKRASTAWEPPREFEEYRVQRLLGAGGMGQVFLARDLLLDRAVAIKFIGDLVEPDADARARFLIEARAAARVAHPNIVAVHRVGEVDGRPFIVSEFVQGESLASLQAPLPWREVVRIGIDLARGLAAAHRQGVLHRDLKPGNAIRTDEGVVKILDFGLAKLLGLAHTENAPPPAAPPPAAPAIDVSRLRHSPRLVKTVLTALPGVAPEPTTATNVPTVANLAQAANVANAATLAIVASAVPAPVAAGSNSFEASLLWHPTALATPLPPAHLGAVTAHGSIMGTPHYMAPETWRAEPASPSSDIYALGAVLHELATGAPPHDQHRALPVHELGHKVQTEETPSPLGLVPDLEPRLAEVIHACLRLDRGQRYASVEAVRDALEQIVVTPPSLALASQEPYRGLAAFDAEHRAYFLGRASQTRAILDRLRTSSFVLVAGDSGVGKSSICRAGVLPLVLEGGLGDGRRWSSIATVVGRHPVAALAAALAPLLSRDEEAVAARLRDAPRELVRELRKGLRQASGLVLFFDQLEELATLSSREDARVITGFIQELAMGVPGVKVLGTSRGDYLTRVAAISGFADEVARAFYLLPPLDAEGVRQAIVGPAAALGVTFESPELVAELARDAASSSGGLPLLQFALAELWRARDPVRKQITRASLAALGGASGALARHADAVIAGLMPGQRQAARLVLTRLVTPEGTRARREAGELTADDPAAARALAALVQGRLVVVREDAAAGERGEHGTTYEITHEALLSGWDTLRRWLGAQAGFRAVVRRLELGAAEWERLGQTHEALWGAAQLEEAAALDLDQLPARESLFLVSSRRRVRSARWRRGLALGGALALVVATWAGVQIANQHEENERRASEQAFVSARVGRTFTEANQLFDDASVWLNAARERRGAAFVAFDRGDAGAEATWATARDAGARAERTLEDAQLRLEESLGYGGGDDVRARLADVLAARAALAELEGRPGDRDELLAHLVLQDAGGTRARRFSAPAALALTDVPEGATVQLERFEAWHERLAAHDVAVASGARRFELPPGSYLVVVRAPGRVEYRQPIVLAAGAGETLAVTAPPAARVHGGFVYVPAGRFLRGAADEAIRADVLHADPLHPAETGAFVIARTETTWADWRRFQAARGRPVATSARGRLPVADISATDALDYLHWLSASGQVRGARLCSELEWERAARGADGRAFPTGAALASTDAVFGGAPGPAEVATHLAGESLFGIDDLAGNVAEMTLAADGSGQVVVKGGGFDSTGLASQAAARRRVAASAHSPGVGLRVCAPAP
jgi:serine/threonine protein kinase/formylglycine-generating enzyme required for sulfatase activity